MVQAWVVKNDIVEIWSRTDDQPSCQKISLAQWRVNAESMAEQTVVFDVKGLCCLEQISRNFSAEKFFDVKLACYLKDSAFSAPSIHECAEKFLPAEAVAEEDGANLLALYDVLVGEMNSNVIFRQIEMPLAPVLCNMEKRGIRLDRAGLEEFGKKLEKDLAVLSGNIYAAAGREFNLNSPKQLAAVLYEELQLPPPDKKGKSGYSTDAETLVKIGNLHPVIGMILEYRRVSKLASSYVENWLKSERPDGKLHTTFNMTATATGRLSSANPNLQNVPVRSELGGEIRKFLIADEGCVLISADYSQIELRILAHLAEDPVMQEAFRSGQDIHLTTAMQIFNVPAASVTGEMRRQAKAVNFGIVYGISAFTLANDLQIDTAAAKNYIKSYFEKYAAVKKYLDNAVKTAKANGFAQTAAGRRRYLPELSGKNFALRSFGERVALNMPVQGTAADLIKTAMIKVESELKKAALTAGLILQIHDELVICAPESEAAAAGAILKEVMENAATFTVPLQVTLSSGKHL